MDSPSLDAFVIRRDRHEEFYNEASASFVPNLCDAHLYASNEDALVGIAKHQLVSVKVWKISFAGAMLADSQPN